jgi:uncharacterized RDD family membrane protein YckC
MNWYYVSQGQQAGPVTQEELLALVREGKISEETLVWQEGMPNWTAFHQANITAAPPNAPPSFQPPPAPNPNEALCVECGKIVPLDETIQYGNVRVCAACKPVFMQKLAEGARIPVTTPGAELRYAGFWIRFAAKFIDGLILGIPVWVIMFIVMATTGGLPQAGNRQAEPSGVGTVLILLLELGFMVVHVGYQIFFLGKYGATPGKMLCKLQVVLSDGTRFGYGLATGRTFAEMLSGMVCYIGYLMVPFDNPQKRALHDHICNTRVVHK